MDKVLVVGGGPAGLAVALTLAKQQVHTVVIEKSEWPRDKVCGEGLMPTGVSFLKKYGIFEQLPQDGYFPFRGIRYYDKNLFAEGNFKSGEGLGIRRINLSTALFRTADQNKYIELRSKTKLLDITLSIDKLTATLQNKNQKSNEEFHFVIGADGLRSQVKKIFKLEGTPPGKQKRWGARQHYAIKPWSDYVEIRWKNGVEAYVTPSGQNRVEIAFLWDKDQFQPQKKEWFTSLLSLFPDLNEKVKDAVSLSEQKGIGPLANGCSSPIADRVVLIGDAQTYLDGITGEGISMAFEQAEIIGEMLPPMICENKVSKEYLIPLQRAFAPSVKRYLILTKLALVFTRHPYLRYFAMRSLSRSPKFFQHFLEANMGARSLFRFPIFSSWQLLLGLLFPRYSNRKFE